MNPFSYLREILHDPRACGEEMNGLGSGCDPELFVRGFDKGCHDLVLQLWSELGDSISRKDASLELFLEQFSRPGVNTDVLRRPGVQLDESTLREVSKSLLDSVRELVEDFHRLF